MTFEDEMANMGIDDPPEGWKPAWEALDDRDPAMGVFLGDGFPDTMSIEMGLEPEVVRVLTGALGAVRNNPAVLRLIRLWKESGIDAGTWNGSWPYPVVSGRRMALFPALVVAYAFIGMLGRHRRRGIPPEVSRDVCRDLGIWMNHAKRVSGEWGFQEFGWLAAHCRCSLYRLGRLQYIHQPFNGGIHAYRNKLTGGIITLSAPGVPYREDGLVNGTNGIESDQPWVSSLESNESFVTGNPVSRRGYASRERMTLDREGWECILAPGDPVLDMHVPEDGRLAPDACRESMERAIGFYAGYLPDLPAPKAFTCGSWLLDSQYEGILGPDSNIVGFLRMFHRFPMKSDDYEPFRRAFGTRPADLATAPRDTGLRRAILDFTLSGGRLHCAGGFIPIGQC